MFTLNGQLISRKGGSFAGHRVQAEFQEEVKPGGENPAAGEVPVVLKPTLRTAEVSPDGSFTLSLPDRGAIKGVLSLEVIAPDGEILLKQEYKPEILPEKIELRVEPKPPFVPQPSPDPFLGQNVKITGLVLDIRGSRRASDLQVSLLARGEGEPENQFKVVLVTRTDTKGYFYGDYPRDRYTEAYGVIGTGNAIKIPIALQDGYFPQKVVLSAELPEDGKGEGEDRESECSCRTDIPRAPDQQDLINSPGTFSTDLGAGRCVDFNVPNRTLEEFSYYSVVRTTEPEIKGLTLEEPKLLPPSVIKPILSKVMVSNIKEAMTPVPGTSDAAVPGAMAAAPGISERLEIAPEVLKKLAKDPEGFTPAHLMTAERLTAYQQLMPILDLYRNLNAGRAGLDAQNPVDWDDEPTFYQAATIAHGHLLNFRQVWRADGYSLGDLLYSLPLAPCQKKQIAVIDWDRKENAVRTERLEEEENLASLLTRDRDISEIVGSVLTESLRAQSSADTWGFGGGVGGFFGVLFGVGGGAGGASSSASQDSARALSASSLQQLRDKTMQASSAVRSQRATVVQTVNQGETMRVQTEVVANHNHCHAVTIQYFEVLRHFQVSQELIDVQECLFIPLLMSRFDMAKSLRWRECLAGVLRNRSLLGGFDAIERILNNYTGSDLPQGRYSEETVEDLDGELRLSFMLARPADNDDQFDPAAWQAIAAMTNKPVDYWYNLYLKGQATKDRIFQEQIAPHIAEAFVRNLHFYLIDASGSMQELDFDPTLVSGYVPGVPLYVSLRSGGSVPPWSRENIRKLRITTDEVLPAYSKVIIHTAAVRYRTRHMESFLFRDYRVMNDLSQTDDVVIPAPLSREELRNPREEDKEISRKLVSHLNEHIEYYHKAIWWHMDPDRRYMLLDGFIAPNSGGRSVASVVENRLIGIVGNCLVMPVARGFHLDPTYRQDIENPVDLLSHYAPNTPIPPMRISVPTKGVFAEAVMGSCNSCEEKDDTRFWKFEESPCGDEPTSIQPVGTESRRAEPGNLEPKDFPAPIINLQNAPAAPDPTGLAAALQLLGNANLFRDITGLAQNQKNALAAFQSSLDAARFFGETGGKLSLQKALSQDIDKTLQTIQNAKKTGLISEEQAKELATGALRGMISGETKPVHKLTEEPEVKKLIDSASESDKSSVSVSRPGEHVDVEKDSEDSEDRRNIAIDLHSQNDTQTRAFNPGDIAADREGDKTGKITLKAVAANTPADIDFRWTVAPAAAVGFTASNAVQTDAAAQQPGLATASFEIIKTSTGATLKKSSIKLSVPQYVMVEEVASEFDAQLTDYQLMDVKEALLRKMKKAVDFLLQKANVRVIWHMPPFNEDMPVQFKPGGAAAGKFNLVKIHGDPTTSVPPASAPTTSGSTIPVGGAIGSSVPNEEIHIWPGSFDKFDPASPSDDVGREVSELVKKMKAMNMTDVNIKTLWIEIMSRVIGETMAHEIYHSLLGRLDAAGHFHNEPSIPFDIMNKGIERLWIHRTGMEVTDPANFPQPGTYTDGGLKSMSTLTPKNQTKIDVFIPVPPTFK